MNLDDIKDRLLSELRTTWERFQESSLYNHGKDRYENLSPIGQKIALYGSLLFILGFLISFPYGYYSSSSSYVGEFENKRELIRDLLKTHRASKDIPDIPIPPMVDAIQSRIQEYITSAKLLPEQNLGVNQTNNAGSLLPIQFNNGNLEVKLMQLNLRQIMDLGHQFQTISPSVKVKDLEIRTNAKDPLYLDATFLLSVLKVPNLNEPPPEEEAPPKKRR